LIPHQRLAPLLLFPLVLVIAWQSAHIIRSGGAVQSAEEPMVISFDIDANLPAEVRSVTGHQVYFYGLARRQFLDLNTFAENDVPAAVEQWGIAPPQAIIMTRGLDEHSTIRDYITEQEMIAVRCYPSHFFGGQTLLYVLPQFADAVLPLVCDVDNIAADASHILHPDELVRIELHRVAAQRQPAHPVH
jgi:hypothetical protein